MTMLTEKSFTPPRDPWTENTTWCLVTLQGHLIPSSTPAESESPILRQPRDSRSKSAPLPYPVCCISYHCRLTLFYSPHILLCKGHDVNKGHMKKKNLAIYNFDMV